MISLNINKDYGYVLLVSLALYLTQQLIMVIPVLMARRKTNIQAPTLYPRDSEIKSLELKEEDVDYYLRAQRAHQNNVEFMSVFLPLFLIIGLFKPKKTAIGGLIVLIFRIIGGIGYLYKKRVFGAAFHFGELYILFLGFQIVYELLKKESNE
tara:strand:+ start:1960 stop:2418 length:459 start_codon:yes stop_codon:yes gene_type:complete